MTQPKFRLSDSKAMLASALQNVRTKGRWPEGKAIFDRRSISRLLMTLVALFAMTTGAWAEDTYTITFAANNKTVTKENVALPKIYQCSFENANGELDLILKELYGWTGSSDYTFCNDQYPPTSPDPSKVEAGIDVYDHYITIKNVFEGKVTVSDGAYVVNNANTYYTLEISFAPTGTSVPLNWDATAKTATLTNGMPAGNVTVSVDYFAQAELAKGPGETPMELAPAPIPNVPANTDAPIVTAGTVANIGTSEVKQGTLMYFVSQPTDNTIPDTPDYDTDGWSEDVPTANELKQGDVYVWYYIKGAEPAQGTDRSDDNTRSDSDIKPLGTSGIVTLAAEPTYDVSLNKTDLAEGEPALWKAKSTNVTTAVNLGEADLEGVKKSETVTVTYTGTKKIIGVKAEKKKVAEGHALTSAKLGEIVCSDGKAYAAADKDNLPKGVKAEALVCYVDGEHGLALAMEDVKNAKMSWDTGRGANDGKTAAEWCGEWNISHPITGATWLLASRPQWSVMISAAGSANIDLSNAFSAVGGTNLQAWGYWSSTPNDSGSAWFYYFPGSVWQWTNFNQDSTGNYIRACLKW